MTAIIEGKLVPVDAIDVAIEYERAPSLVEDDALRKSIEKFGIQQPVVLITKPDGRYGLIDGSRRVEIARILGIKNVPAVIDQAAPDLDTRGYMDRVRFLLDEHRQQLFPSQRAILIKKLMDLFQLKQKDVAEMLGLDPGSVTNHLAVLNYSPEIIKAIDTNETDLFHARAWDGMKPEAQSRLFKTHRKDMATMSGGKFHKLIRSKYPPRTHPDYYVSPENTEAKLQRKQKGRKSRRRPTLGRDDKKRLMQSLDLQETERNELQEEIKEKKRLCVLAGPIAAAILRHPDLVEELPRLHVDREELEVFSESF